jgi:hypothetical protein
MPVNPSHRDFTFVSNRPRLSGQDFQIVIRQRNGMFGNGLEENVDVILMQRPSCVINDDRLAGTIWKKMR